MLKFSAELNYEINKDNKVTFIEKKHINNSGKDPVEVPGYHDLLPEGVNIDTIKCYFLRNDDKTGVAHRLDPIPGSNRVTFSIPANKEKILLENGDTTVVTEYQRSPFFEIVDDKGLYVFYLHYSLPDLPYLTEKTPKKVTIKIEKPASKIIYRWDLWSLKHYEKKEETAKSLTSMDDNITLQFYLDLNPNEHYFNTIILRKRPRLDIPFPFFKALFFYIKHKVSGNWDSN